MSPTEPPAAERPRVVVAGNLCWDVIIRGLPELPRWGEEAEGTDNLQAPGGQGFNLAVALAGLGADVTLIGAVGDDAGGEQILTAAAQAGVDVRGVTIAPQLPTAVTAALVRPDGERAFASDFGCQRRWGAPEILADPDLLTGAQALCVVGQFNIPGLTVAGSVDVMRAGRAAGATTVVDTGWDPLGWTEERRRDTRAMLTEVDVFLPNLDEARAIVGGREVDTLADALRSDGSGIVVVKCGVDGSVGRAGGQRARAGTLEVEVRDLVGAGDTFDAGFLLGHLGGRPLGDAMALGAAAAGLRVSGSAARWPTQTETEDAARSVVRQTS